MAIHDITVRDVIQRHAASRHKQTAFVQGERRWSFGQYFEDLSGLAAGLASVGIRKGDRIAVLLLNSYSYFVLYGAAASMGAIVLPLNWRSKQVELQVILEMCTPRVVVVDPALSEMAAGLKNDCVFVEHWLCTEDRSGFELLHDLMTTGTRTGEISLSQEDPYIILPTAAVEGKPRGAVLSHRNVVAGGVQIMAHMGINPDTAYLNLMPLYHVMDLEVAFAAFLAGGRNVIQTRFDPEQAVRVIEDERVSVIAAVPPMLASILDKAESSGWDIGSLRVVAGLAEQPETVARLHRMTQAQFWVGFGQTETFGYVTLCPYEECPGSSGREGVMVRMRLVDEYDREVAPGQPGEVVVRGPLVFSGYWNLKEGTEYVFRDGWHHTGDVCRLDDHGYLWYVKRKAEKELIKPGGENVYPAEVEKVLVEHPDIVEACVFGVPDAEWGEAVKAVCVLKSGSPAPGPKEVTEFVASRIARHKKPKFLVFVDALPKREDGSVDRDGVKVEYGGR
jgi:acyl-CoA synthetase (AMP-forming)/AMP-acid ligase II